VVRQTSRTISAAAELVSRGARLRFGYLARA
jgi:hypothetical protein